MPPPPHQPEFDFDRGDRLALLDALPLSSGSVHDGRASVRVSGATAKSVLRLGSRVTAGALYWRLRRAHPSLPPSDGWPVETLKAASPPAQTPNDVFMRVVRPRRRAGLSDDQIRPELERALVAAGFAPDAEKI